MKITLIANMSIDGKITKGEDHRIRSWASSEDVAFFEGMIASHDLLVMGRKTYQAIRVKTDEAKRYVVMTHTPELFASHTIEGQLEFSGEDPRALTRRMENAGYTKLLLTGGGHVYTSFLEAGLVDELYITIEPYIFGEGTDLLARRTLNIKLTLENVRRLNDTGTVLLHYIA
jgi:dihydrofolate reductase